MRQGRQVFFAAMAAALLLFALVAMAGQVSDADVLRIKAKIEAAEFLTAEDIALAGQINATTTSRIDIEAALARAKAAAVGALDEPRDRQTLDDYMWMPTTYDWVDIVGVGTNTGITGDDQNAGPFALGFTFPFFGSNYTNIRVCSNGWLSFTSTATTYSNTAIPNTADPNNALYLFWDDMYPPSGGQILYYADAANQRFIVTWNGVPHISSGTAAYTFQVILYPTGNIIYQYNTIPTASPGNTSCTVGIENSAGTQAVQICYNGAGTLPTSGTAFFIGEPTGVPRAPTNLAGNVVGGNVVLTWTDPTLDTQGQPVTLDNLQVWLGPVGTGTLLGTVNPGVQTYTHVSPPTGALTYNVRAYHNPYFGPPASVQVIVGSPTYVNDFETDNGMWVPDPATGGWEWGTPTGAAAPTPHSGTKVWGTVLGADYPNNACFKLDLNLGLVVQSSTASVDFWRWFNTESSFDGCNFQASTDDGATWTVLTPTGGYPGATNTANTCNPSQPAWTGNAGNSWVQVSIPIGQYQGQAPIFRFVFGSDGSVVYPGFFFDDMIIWGLAQPQSADVSGTVTLDGLGGNITNVTVRANGLGAPTTNPAANGAYTLTGVQVGNRILQASLTGYITSVLNVNVPVGGLTNQNFTLRRENPPAPTGLTGSVNSSTGLVTLDWADSPDLQVDQYRIYRKLRSETDWTHVGTVTGRTNSTGTNQLTTGGIYNFRVTAVDTNVIPPAVESDPSLPIELAWGALPPQMLMADTAFDNKIRLRWLDPLAPPTHEIYYDSVDADITCLVDGLGFTSALPFAWFATHYQGSGPVTIYRIKTRHWQQTTVPVPMQYAVFADSGGMPTLTPLGTTDWTMTDPLIWQDVELTTPVTINNGSFFIAIRQVTAARVNIGMDDCSGPYPSTFFYVTQTTGPWADLAGVGFPETLCMRAIVAGNVGGPVMELAPSPVSNPWALALSEPSVSSKSSKMELGDSGPRMAVTATHRAPQVGPRVWPASTVFRPNVAPYVLDGRGRETLDDLVRYLIYRGGVRIDSVAGTITQYDNIVGSQNENVPYTYYVTARYDNGQESIPTNSVTARCNMPPGAPTGLTLTRVGTTEMRLNWTDPTVNADNTPCTDLVSLRVYRDGVLRATVPAGTQQYLDGPLTPAQRYEWAVYAIDEVPNQGPAASASGVAGNPSYDTDFENDNGGWVAEPATGGWEWGVPAAPPTPHSGNKVWGTVLNGTYPNSVCWTLTLAPGLIVQDGNARVDFWRWYSIESAWDGCNFKVSVDGGSTWTTVEPTGGYGGTTNTGNTCNPSQPAWTGTTGTTWQVVSIPIGQYIGQTPMFRFVFGTDASVVYPGFYFDDMTIWGLQPSSSIAGTVRSLSPNVPLSGARVWAVGQPDTATTDGQGQYTLALEPGTYSVGFRHATHCDTTYNNVVVVAGQQTVRDAVLRRPVGAVSVTSINMVTYVNVPVEQTFQITNTGGQCPLSFSITDTSAWLTVTPASGTVNPNEAATITAHATVTGMGTGDYVSRIRVVYNSTGSPVDIRVDLHIELDAGDPHAAVPTEFAYHQNYPNPFNATTALRFDVPSESRVTLAIYNVMGQEVARPVDQVCAPGRYNVLFNAADLPSGMYLVKMTAGNFSQMGKMMLLK